MAVWWPPVAAALRALGLLYGALDGRTFGGLAQEAVAAATASVQHASRAVAKRALLRDSFSCSTRIYHRAGPS